ncbi:patatin family protein [Heterostelium album PN500]|uniref:Patatin family protein n=1 Tax=Heterostelium pallidum (strain ATCC 26659 / Pp 5 / PN500) TaxID=670386 RepID=D3BBE0_HETP5|nr:patatin family protein [Heterostelium album PN500]EFA80973.1 patatin family protein [Heterostelium album PN500]|eukprot:XP_020433091.1 patatin family protein [Heterostelium album PN500]
MIFDFDSKGRLFLNLWIVKPFHLQPWMAMTIGVFAILGAFRLYVYISTRSIKKRYAPAHRRKDSIAEPLLLLKQMINTKPKKFGDIFPEELRELAKRRVAVLKEANPFGMQTIYNNNYQGAGTGAGGGSPGSGHGRSNMKRSSSLNFRQSPTLGRFSPKTAFNPMQFRTPQSLKSGSTIFEKEPSPLALSPTPTFNDNSVNINNTNINNTSSSIGSSLLTSPTTTMDSSGKSFVNSPAAAGFNSNTTASYLKRSNNSIQKDEINFINEQEKLIGGSPKIGTVLQQQQQQADQPTIEEEEEDRQSDSSNTSSSSNNFQDTPPMFRMGSSSGKRIVPSTNYGLVGLALSGGGIRSATFNLGLLQALSKHRLFRKVDYLSTVSGGGFIGSCLISLLSEGTHTSDWNNFPFHYSRGMKEGIPLKHLRNSANYLANGLFEFLLFPVLILRGIVLNLISIFPFVWGLLLFERYVPIKFGVNYYLTLRIAWNLLIHILIFPLISRPKVTIPAIILFLSIYSTDLSAFFSKANNFEIAASLCLHLYLNHPWLLRKEDSKVWYDRSFGWLFIVLISLGFVESLPLIENVYIQYFGGETSFRVYPLFCLFALILADSLAFTLLTNPKLSPVKRLTFHIFVSIVGPLLLILTYLELSVWLDSSSSLFGIGNGICFFVSLLSFFTMDINETSMHKYYRDRLSKAYMFSIKNGRFRPYGGEKISRLNRRSVAPYLLINTTLNYTTNNDPNGIPDSRGSDFFMFSQHFVGSETCGYRSTEQMEKLDRRLDLATAVSISGAAVGTKMGTATIPTLVLSLGILNIRLGYWLPNPLGIFLSHPYLGRLFYGGFACYHLVKEFGWTAMTSKDWCINLSDGGHIENLGAYELIKRRCKYVIISDAEADPDMTFPSLAQLMRLVRIDFGINIQINLDDIRRGGNGYSQKHWTVGKIIYQKKKSYSNPQDSDTENPPSGEVGYLLYIKSSLTGDEDEVIKEYQSQHPSFPHESTTDQFFTESQFEAYRSLGYHIGGSSLFGPKHNRLFDGEDVDSFFERIYQSCTGELPKGWQEKRDDSGSQYFVQQDMKKKTWFDPRLRKTSASGTQVPPGVSQSASAIPITTTVIPTTTSISISKNHNNNNNNNNMNNINNVNLDSVSGFRVANNNINNNNNIIHNNNNNNNINNVSRTPTTTTITTTITNNNDHLIPAPTTLTSTLPPTHSNGNENDDDSDTDGNTNEGVISGGKNGDILGGVSLPPQ